MINLIPNEEKKKMKMGFYFRLVIVAFHLLAFSALIATASLLPSYFISNVRKNLAVEAIRTQESEPIPSVDQEAIQEIGELKKRLMMVENAEKSKFLITEKIINEVLSERLAGVRITEIGYKKDIDGAKKITIQGTAPSREHLLLFRKALEENKAFTEVDLPISNFIQGSNIIFSLSLKAL